MEVHYHASLESMKRVVHLVVVAMLLSSACLLTFPWILPPLEPATFAFSEITYQVSFYAACSFLLNLFLGSLAFIPLAFGRYLFEGKLRSIILTPPPRESFQQHR
jgi:hypothetical protein